MALEKQQIVQTEKHKALGEYLRFLTTLSTGSIVILTSFLGRLQAQPNLGFLVGVALVAFMVSIVGAVISYTMVIMYFGVHLAGGELNLSLAALVIVWLSFLVAVVALTVFGLANL